MRFYEVNGGEHLHRWSPDHVGIRRSGRMYTACLAWCCRIPGCLRERCGKIWCTTRSGVTDEELERACRACGIYSLCGERCRRALTRCLSERVSYFSGAEQLFTIARAMIQNSPMLILDEATSSVDTRTEADYAEGDGHA